MSSATPAPEVPSSAVQTPPEALSGLFSGRCEACAGDGVRMAQDNYMLYYWGPAFKQASDALRAQLGAMQLKPPAGRRWIVEICGPQRPAEVALGDQFETTWDRKRADFAMMLGTFYCRDLHGPALVEIAREGVVYARVYDIRGRPVPNLLTEPPP